MSKIVSATELRKMPAADLKKEIADKRAEVSKMKVFIEMRKHKDTAEFRREKKELARMLTVLNQLESSTEQSAKTPLKTKPKTSRVSAPKKSASSSN